ncbi:heat-inducible transcriptional repressor HrcA [Candidatus Spongiisocius sp.]|uniref:heat-inducible transcriptional repressor HrcA n=1 Tax=Candidatus Spongiisocius sp. TaxID=3101273 RepID=UPI003B5BD0FD
MLDGRRARILRIMIEEHIRTGEPVSSRAILESGNLAVSSATIRTELVALEAAGYAFQPHTSAGRIPTPQAYRYYVDSLMRPRETPVASARVAEFFASVQTELGRLLKATSALLSEITHFPSVVTSPSIASEVIRAVHLVRTTVNTVLMVVVTVAGRVSQTLLHLPVPVDSADVQEAERLIRRFQVGTSMAESLDLEAMSLANPTQRVASVLRQAAAAFENTGAADHELYMGSSSYLTAAWGELSKVQGVLDVLEREAALLEVLGHLPAGTEVRIGSELGIDSATDISLVTTTYGEESAGPAGRLGVLGPMRMDYGRTIRVLEEIGDGLDESLGES